MRGIETDGIVRLRASHACPPSTKYMIFRQPVHVVASVRALCPSRPLPPCLVRMLNEPFMQLLGQLAIQQWNASEAWQFTVLHLLRLIGKFER
jgi:hypothetical protein